METFFLQNESGLFLTNRESNTVELEKQDFSTNQTWYWSGDMIMCGTGKVLDCQYGMSASSPDEVLDQMWKKFYFHEIEDDTFYIAKYEDKGKIFEENDEPQRFLSITEEGTGFMKIIEDSKIPFIWRKVSTDQAYKWKMMDSNELPENAFAAGQDQLDPTKAWVSSIFVGRGEVNGELHVGKVINDNRYIGFHDEDKMATETFYLESESGLYLTNSDSDSIMLTLSELDISPGQTWYWDKSSGEAKNLLMCGNGTFLQMDTTAQGSVVLAREAFSEDETRHLFYSYKLHLEDEEEKKILIGRFVEKEGEKEANNEPHVFLGFKKDGTEWPTMDDYHSNSDMQFQWKKVSTNQTYQWVAMDSELPENALDAGKDEGDTSSVFVGRGEVNGKIHLGNVRNGNRNFVYECTCISSGEWDHCSHCCKVFGKCSPITAVTSEKFSVLCVEPDAEVEWIEFPNIKHPTRPYHCDWSKFPRGSVIGGVIKESLYYVGRGIIGNQIVPGFFEIKYADTALVVIHDGEMHKLKQFEMLVIRKKGGENIKMNVDKVHNEIRYFGIDNLERTVTSEKFTVLCKHPDAELEWVKYQEKKLPNGAVIGGVFDGGLYYVGRGIIEDQSEFLKDKKIYDTIIPGMFLHQSIPSKRTEAIEHTLYALYNGEMIQLNKFEVLVVTKTVEEKATTCVSRGLKEEEWKLVRGGDVPKEFEIVEIDETNFSEYQDIINSLTIKALEDGTITLAHKMDVKIKKEELQEQVDQMAQMFSPFKIEPSAPESKIEPSAPESKIEPSAPEESTEVSPNISTYEEGKNEKPKANFEFDELTNEVEEKAFAKADTDGTGKLTMDQLKVAKLIRAADKDGNGFLIAAELKELVLKMTFKEEDEVDELVTMFMMMGDTDGDKKLKIEEVVSLFTDGPKKEDPKEEMKRMFRMFDTNEDGFISKKEFVGYLNFLGCVDKDETPAEVKMIVNMMMAEADKDGDSKLNYDEFCTIME